MEIERQEQELNKIKGDQMNINFGSQIRSYVMHPYSMVKDHRTNTETSPAPKPYSIPPNIAFNSNFDVSI